MNDLSKLHPELQKIATREIEKIERVAAEAKIRLLDSVAELARVAEVAGKPLTELVAKSTIMRMLDYKHNAKEYPHGMELRLTAAHHPLLDRDDFIVPSGDYRILLLVLPKEK